MRSLLAAVTVVLAAATGAAGSPSFRLVFDGRHNADLLHEGTFSSSASWCPSGTAADVGVDATTDTAVRRFTCAGGGEFTAKIRPLPAEHGGGGSWQIVGGSGPLADLRGKGAFTSTFLTGTAGDPATITFRSTWNGVADLDAAPPGVAVRSASARKAPLRPHTFDVLLGLSLTDNGGGAISYVLQIVDVRKPSAALVYKLGTAAGTVTLRYRIKPPKTTRAVRIEIDATDEVGNAASEARTLKLP